MNVSPRNSTSTGSAARTSRTSANGGVNSQTNSSAADPVSTAGTASSSAAPPTSRGQPSEVYTSIEVDMESEFSVLFGHKLRLDTLRY